MEHKGLGGSILMISFLLFLIFIGLLTGENQESFQKTCIFSSNFTIIQSPHVINVAYYSKNGSVTSFSESFGAWPVLGGSGYSVIEEWSTQLGIAPPCHMQRGEVKVRIEKGIQASHDVYICQHNPTPADPLSEKCLWEYTSRTARILPPGEVKIATFVVPIGEGSWKKTDMPFCNKSLDLTTLGACPPVTLWVNGTCTCKPEEILKATLNKIKSSGFKEKEHVKILETEALKPMYSAFFVKDSQYLYVEFSEVKGMNLVRVLMIMGDEEIVKAYAKAFTAGNIEG